MSEKKTKDDDFDISDDDAALESFGKSQLIFRDPVSVLLENAYVGQKIRIAEHAPFFQGKLAFVAYIGSDGVSVYLANSDFDEPIALKVGEWDVVN